MRKLLAVLVLLLTSSVVCAQSLLAPALQEGKHVYSFPESYVPDIIGLRGLQEINAAAAALHYPFKIALVKSLPVSGSEQTDKDLELAIKQLAIDWGNADARFDRARTSLVIISMGPGKRKFGLLAAPRWRAEVGLESPDAVKVHRELFTQAAKKGDYVGGVIQAMQSLDRYVFERTDPVFLAERKKQYAAQAEAQALILAQASLDEQITKLTQLLESDKGFLPSDTASYQERLSNARKVRSRHNRVEMRNLAAELFESNRVLEAAISKLRKAHADKIGAFSGVTLLLTLSVVLVIVLVQNRRNDLASERWKLQKEIASWRAKITNASQRLYAFDEYRDRADVLRTFTGETADTYKEAITEIDAIVAGVEAVSKQLDSAEAMAATATFFKGYPLRDAHSMLNSSFLFDTGGISEKLFDPETKVVEVRMASFGKELEERHEFAMSLWKSLNDAVTTSLRLPDELFPATGLEELESMASKWGIPPRWLRQHPLIGDAAADHNLYAQLNQLRLTDPLGFVHELERVRVQELDVKTDLSKITSVLERVAEVRMDELQDLPETHVSPEDDPQLSLNQARQNEARLQQLLLTADDVAEIEEQAKKTVALYAACRVQYSALMSAVQNATKTLKQVEAVLRRAQTRREEVERLLHDARRNFSNTSSAEDALQAADRYLAAGSRDLDRAGAKLSEKRHLGAVKDAKTAEQQFGNCFDRLDACTRAITDLQQQKKLYEQKLRTMGQLRNDAAQLLHKYGGSSDSLAAFAAQRVSGPANYYDLLQMLVSVESDWDSEVASAKRAKERAEQLQREEDEAKRKSTHSNLYSSSHTTDNGFSVGNIGSDSGGGGFSGGSIGGDSSGGGFSGGDF